MAEKLPPKRDSYTRREFFQKLLKPSSESDRQETAPEKQERIVIETENANYYPIYEDHIRPKRKEIEVLPPSSSLLVEVGWQSDQVLSSSPEQILHAEGATSVAHAGEELRVKLGRIFTDEQLDFLARNNQSVALEGFKIPPRYFEAAATIELAETIIGLGTLSAGTVDGIVRKFENKLSRRDVLKYLAALGLSTWTLSSTMPESFLTDQVRGGNKLNEEDTTLRKAQQLHGQTSHLHPEILPIYLRNVIIARKLKLLARQDAGENNKKADIGYRTGFLHSGIERFLPEDDDETLVALSIYPDNVLQEIVDYNGGIDAFSSTVVIPVRENIMEGKETKRILVDEKLKAFLTKS